MNVLHTNIKLRRMELGLSQEELAKKVGYKSRSSINKVELGINDLPQSKIKEFAKALETTPAFLMGWSEDSKNQNDPIRKKARKILTELPIYCIPVSAGTGEWLGEGREYEFADFENVPQGADFALAVRGNSMEPMYSDDDIVFVKTNVIVESGQIGVFCLNGEGYLKMLQGNKLVSLNRDYDPIVIEEWDTFFCVGRVIGKM